MSTSATYHSNAKDSSGYWYDTTITPGGQLYFGSNYYSYHSWVYFAQTIPQYSTIVSAHARMYSYNSLTGTTCSVKLHFVNAGNATQPTTVNEANALSLTAGTPWTAPAFSASNWYETDDIASELQTVVDREDYTSGNIVFVIKDNSSSPYAYRQPAGATDPATNLDIELHVVYGDPPSISVSGAVTRFGTGIDGVTMTFSSGLGGGTVATSGGGLYTKSVSYGGTGTVTPSKTGETFTPTSKTYTHIVADDVNENYTMDFYVTPAASLAYTTVVPTYSFTSNIPVVSIAYTTYIPSRNYYEISTAGITFSTLEPWYSTGYVDVRQRLNINAIGERISLKFQNTEAYDLVLNDIGYVLSQLYRRDSVKLNAKGKRLSMKFQNNVAATPFELQYFKVFEEVYEHLYGTKMNVVGKHLSFKFQNNTSDTPFELQYLNITGEVYENQ